MENLAILTELTPSSSRILATKLTPPITGPLVARALIEERLTAAGRSKLILVTAPAGFGKTSLMTQYQSNLRSQGIATAWLLLDQADNDLERFILYLDAAFCIIESDNNYCDVTAYREKAKDASEGLSNIAFRISTFSDPFVLFIDEFEAIHNPAVLDFVRLIIAHLPINGNIVIGSRSSPNLGLARLRVRHQLTEITSSDLKFSTNETAEFIREKRKIQLNDQQIKILQEHTEGWAAALQLASLSLASRPYSENLLSTFSKNNADVAKYLAEDVFANQPPELRDFLLRTCILRELSASLCNAITGRTDSAILLERLEQGNVLITRTDSNRREYRYHSLFSDFLREQLTSEYPWAIPSLHLSASKWFLAQERAVPAIEHALMSDDLSVTLSLMDKHAEQLLKEGRFGLLARWAEGVPKVALAQYPRLRIIFAWAYASTRHQSKAKDMLDTFVSPAEPFRTWISALRAYSLTMEDSTQQCLHLCKEELSGRSLEISTQFSTITVFYGYSLVATDQFSEALKWIEFSKRSFAGVDSAVGVAIADRVQATMELAQGRLRDSTMRLRRAYQNVADSSRVSLIATVGVVLAVVLYEGGDIESAERLLNDCLALAQESGIPDILIFGTIVRSRILCAAGNRDQALEALADMEMRGHQDGLPRLVANAWLERSRMAIMDGNISLAHGYLKNADDGALWKSLDGITLHANDVDSLEISRLRLMIHSNQSEVAIPILKRNIKEATHNQRHHRALKLEILLAYALKVSGDWRGAMRVLKEALLFASQEGFVSTFRDEGECVANMLKEYHAAASDKSAPDEPSAAFVQQLVSFDEQRHASHLRRSGRASGQITFDLAESLTEREIEVLTLLASGLSNQQLAKKLFVSESTVKTHLARINMKLGAHNRTQALATARGLGIID